MLLNQNNRFIFDCPLACVLDRSPKCIHYTRKCAHFNRPLTHIARERKLKALSGRDRVQLSRRAARNCFRLFAGTRLECGYFRFSLKGATLVYSKFHSNRHFASHMLIFIYDEIQVIKCCRVVMCLNVPVCSKRRFVCNVCAPADGSMTSIM